MGPHPPLGRPSTEFRPKLPVDAISVGRPGHALLLDGSQIGEVRLVPWWRQSYWDALSAPADFSPDQLKRFAPPSSR